MKNYEAKVVIFCLSWKFIANFALEKLPRTVRRFDARQRKAEKMTFIFNFLWQSRSNITWGAIVDNIMCGIKAAEILSTRNGREASCPPVFPTKEKRKWIN